MNALAYALLWLAVSASPAAAAVRVSQVYGGGGNSNAPYQRDFIEVFNAGTDHVDLDGWSVQYAAATGSTWQVTALAGTLPAGAALLIGQASGGPNGSSLDVDIDGTIALAAGAGKVALVASTTTLAGACPDSSSIVDLVGYGSANCFEGSGAVPALGNALAAIRRERGCTDTDQNAADFAVAAPQPRSRADTPIPCGGSADPTPSAAATATEPPTPTPSDSATFTASPAPTDANSPTPSPTATEVPTLTLTPTPIPTPTASGTPTTEPSATATPSASPTPTSSPTSTGTPTASPTVTSTTTPTSSPTWPPAPGETPSSTPPPTATECGNGALDPGEHCDSGGGGAPGCPEDCVLSGPGKLAFGHARLRRTRERGCWLGWYLAHGDPSRTQSGSLAPIQHCVDQDPGCDYDPTPGVCVFRLAPCMNVVSAELDACGPTTIRDVIVAAPRARRTADDGRTRNAEILTSALAAMRSLRDVDPVPSRGAPIEPVDTDVCAVPLPIRIELGRMPRRSLTVVVRARGGRDGTQSLYSRLRLVCSRAPR